MAIWIVLAVHIGENGRVERVRWQREEGARVGDPVVVEAHVVAGALGAGDKVYTLKASPCGTAVGQVSRVEYPGGGVSIEFEDVGELPTL